MRDTHVFYLDADCSGKGFQNCQSNFSFSLLDVARGGEQMFEAELNKALGALYKLDPNAKILQFHVARLK